MMSYIEKSERDSIERVHRLKAELFADTLEPQEVADVLGLDKSTIMRYLRSGTLVGFQIGRSWFIRESALREYIALLEKT